MRPRTQNTGSAVAEHLLPFSAAKTSGTAEAGSEKRRSCAPLRSRFRHGGFAYRQIVREGDTAVYEQIWASCFNAAVCYEVVRIRRREGFHIGDRFVEPAEVYPNSEAWGVDGWTAEDKDAAFRKLREVVVERGISADELAIRLLISSQMEAE